MIPLKPLSEKEQELRAILLAYANKKQDPKLKKRMEIRVANGTINLSDYKDIIKQNGFNKVYKSLYKELMTNAEKIRKNSEKNSIKDKSEEQESQDILKMFKEPSDYYSYDINRLEELLARIKVLIESKNIYLKTKQQLKLVKTELLKIINEYHNKDNKNAEKALRNLVDRYYNGEKEKVIREILQNEKQYLDYSLNPNVSVLTKKRFNPIKEYCLLLKKEIQNTLYIQLIAYLSKEDPDIDGQYKKEYNYFYKNVLPNYQNRDLSEIISLEDKTRIDNIIKEIKEKKLEEDLKEKRGYSEENLTLIKQLIEHYKNNKPIIDLSSRVGIDKKRISKYMVSTYLVKFENDKKLSQEDFETYKEFAEKYGDKLLSWIILEKEIKETDSIDITTIKKEIASLHRRIKFDNSLTEKEKDTLVEKIIMFIDKAEKINNQTPSNKVNIKKY